MNSNADRTAARAQRVQCMRIADIALRCLVLYFLDFLLNGTLLALVVHNIVDKNATDVHIQQFGHRDTNETENGQVNNRSELLEHLQQEHQTYDNQYFVNISTILLLPERSHISAGAFFGGRMYLCVWLIYCVGFCAGILLLLLSTKQLFWFFQCCLPVALLGFSYYWNISFCIGNHFSTLKLIDHLFEYEDNSLFFSLCMLLYNIVAVSVFFHLYKLFCNWKRGTVIVFFLPITMILLGCPSSITTTMCTTTYVPLFLLETVSVISHFVRFCHTATDAVSQSRGLIHNFGLRWLLLEHWTRLQVPVILRTFCLSRFILHLVLITGNASFGQYYVEQRITTSNSSASDTWDLEGQSYFYVVLWDVMAHLDYVIVRSCETIIAILGTTSVVSVIGNKVGQVFHFILEDDDDNRHSGGLTGALFFILAIQSGLTTLTIEKRLIKLYRNFWLLSTAFLHFIHAMTNSVLQKLSTSGNYKLSRHLRAVCVATFLLIVPTVSLRYLYVSQMSLNPWVVSVVIFTAEVFIKTLVSVIVYALLMVGMKSSTATWERLDDYVYYVKGCGATLEFTFGVLLLLNGVWIMVYDYGGVIRPLMICLHAYCNVWVQGWEGWATFKRRRNASKHVVVLRDAGAEELVALNDVCSICYEEMSTAKVTNCGHFFHANCLRRCLYSQDKCPMCHAAIFDQDSSSVSRQAGEIRQN